MSKFEKLEPRELSERPIAFERYPSIENELKDYLKKIHDIPVDNEFSENVCEIKNLIKPKRKSKNK